MALEITTGSHTPGGTTVETVATFSSPGVLYLVVGLDNLQAGDTVDMWLNVSSGAAASGRAQHQQFVNDQGDTVAEFVAAFATGAVQAPQLLIQQSVGTARVYPWVATLIPEL